MDRKQLLRQCGIAHVNSGVFTTKWERSSGKSFFSYNPATEEPLASVNPASMKQVEAVFSSAHQVFQTWSEIPAPKRGEVVRQIGEALRKNKDILGSLIALEMGKIKSEGDGEVQEMIDMADFAAGQSRMLYGSTMHSERFHHRMFEQWHPLGVVGVITAFNFPMAVWAWNAFLAAIAGNTVIWKPSSQTPLCAIAVQKICEEVMKRNQCLGVFSLMITPDKKNTECLLKDKRIRLISFTGSSDVGHQVNQAVSKRLGRCLLECSGNNAIILDKTADLSIALPAIVFGSVGTAGQRCTTTRRLIIHETIYQNVIDLLVKAYRQIKIGDPLDANNLMGPLINASAVAAYKTALEKIKKSGGKILTGGKVLKRKGYFVEPVIATAQNHWDIVQQETFAPILYVMKFKQLDEAIEYQNSVPQGLSSALFTRDLIHMEQYLSCKGSDCGIANINIGTSGAEIGGAFGGEKETGGGREAGSDVWKNYMRRQTNTINWSNALPLAQGIKFYVEK